MHPFGTTVRPRPACIVDAARTLSGSAILVALFVTPLGAQRAGAPCTEPALARLGALCSQVVVAENPAMPTGRSIALHIVTIPARSAAKQPDPIFVLAGGPGQGAASLAPWLAASHAALNVDRDLVFMDQRGTGRSNALACPAADSGIQGLLKPLFDSVLVAACRRKLEAKADLSMYGAPSVVADIEHVRQALGVRQLNFHGTSYGTRVALEYMRLHPRNVRSAILLGAAPVDMQMPLHYARDAQVALDALSRDCAVDPSCSRHGRVNELADSVLRLAATGRLSGTITDPVTGRQHLVTPTRGWVAEVIRHELYSAYSAAGLPAALHAAATGDADDLITRGLERRRVLDWQIALGVLLSASCSEDVRAIDRGTIGRMTAGTFLGDSRVRDQVRACALWPSAPVPAAFGTIAASRVPALLLSGANDPATGPSWAGRVATRLGRAQHLVIPYAGHGLDGLRNAQCVAWIQAEFIRRAAPVGDVASCLTSITRTPFESAP